jgi:hypothetical protein
MRGEVHPDGALGGVQGVLEADLDRWDAVLGRAVGGQVAYGLVDAGHRHSSWATISGLLERRVARRDDGSDLAGDHQDAERPRSRALIMGRGTPDLLPESVREAVPVP